jgi:hypothetical protein
MAFVVDIGVDGTPCIGSPARISARQHDMRQRWPHDMRAENSRAWPAVT